MRTDLLRYALVLVVGLVLGAGVTAVAGAGGEGVWVLHKSAADTYSLAGGKAHAHLMLGAATGAKKASMGYLEGVKGFEVPAHKHADSAELLWFVKGAGTLTIRGKAYEVQPGSAIYIPAGAEHAFTASQAFEAVQVYAGPGPEQRFRKVGKAVARPTAK
jgi:putative monooxygenase